MKQGFAFWLFIAFLYCVIGFSQGMIITEIMYHPPEHEAGDLEFVEIYNYTASPLDISGFRLTQGVFYVFPEGTWLSSYSYAVIAKDPAAFQAAYGAEAYGPYLGDLADTGERITLTNDSGRYDPSGIAIIPSPSMSTVNYNDRGQWPASCNGGGHSLSLLSYEMNENSAASWTASPYRMGTPGYGNGFEVTYVSTDIIVENETWRFKRGTEEASAPIDAWRHLDFDDSGWETGQAGFGYGDNDDTTVLEDMQQNDDNTGYNSLFIRKKFTLTDLASIDKLSLNIYYDDGFVAYLNGHEVARDNVDDDPPLYTSEASSHEANRLEVFDLSDAIQYLKVGENVLAVQGHNQRISSPDFSLHPLLVANDRIDPVDSNSVVINEAFYYGQGEGWIELYNNNPTPFDLGGCFLSRDPDQLDGYEIPQDKVVPPNGFLALTESEIGFNLDIDAQAQATMTILLSAPDLKRVINARTFDSDITYNGSAVQYPDGSGRWFKSLTPTRGEANQVDVEDAVVINEIMFHPFHEVNPHHENAQETDRDREFLELYNISDRRIDLSGWYFSSGITYIFPEGTAINPKQYLVIAFKPSLIQEIYGLTSEQVLGPFDGRLSNNGELIRLRDAYGNVTDEVRYSDGGDWAQWGDVRSARWADGRGASLELIDPRQDNNTGAAWSASDDRHKAEWTEVSFSGRHASNGESELQFLLIHAGEMLLDDVHVSENTPDGSNMIRNPGFEDGDQYWRLWPGTHENSTVVSGDAHSGNNALLVVSSGHGDNWANNVEYDLTSPRLIANRTYHIRFWAKWQRGNNWFYVRDHRGAQTTAANLVHCAQIPAPENLGTPGAQNSVYQENLGPVFKDLLQTPAVPQSSQKTHITCTIADADGIQAVMLHYKMDRQEAVAIPMADDGTQDDGAAGDNVWGAAIPAQGRNRQIMAFWMTAEDNQGQTSVYPPQGEAQPFAFQVVDVAPSTRLPTYRMIQLADDATYMNTRLAMSNSLVPASFVFNEKVIHHKVGVRYRGSPWIRPGNKGSGYLFRFNKHQPVHGRLGELNLDKQHPNSNQAQIRERTAYHLMRYTSRLAKNSIVPYSHQQYISFLAAGSSAGQIYEHVQRVDNPYLEYWFAENDRGTLYKADDWFECTNDANPRQDSGRTARLTYLGASKELYRWYFKLRTNEKWDPYQQLIDLTRNVQQTSSSQMPEKLAEWLDVDEWLAILCVRFYIGDWDTIGFNRGKNAYLYRMPNNGLWYLLPWDSDLTFQTNHVGSTLIVNSGTFPAMSRMFNIPAHQRRLYQFYDYLLKGPADIPFITDYWDRTYNETFQGETLKPPAASATISFMQSRNNTVRQRIYSGSFRLRSPSQNELAVFEPTLKISADAPTNIAEILVNGTSIMEQLVWRTMTRWEYTLTLAEGTNVLNFVGLDTVGEEAGEFTLTVHFTNNPAPEVTSVSPEQCSDDALPDDGNPDGKVVVTIKGANFINEPTPPKVFFGNQESPEVTFIDAETLEAVVPPNTDRGADTVDLTVTNFDTREGELADGFSYYPLWPDLQVIQPDALDCDALSGDDRIEIMGERFSENTRIFIGDLEATDVTFNSVISLSVKPPCGEGLSGQLDVRAVNPDGRSSEMPSGIEFFCAPKVTRITPAAGSDEGGYNVTILGDCFDVESGPSVVTFNFQLATIIEATPTRYVVTVPSGSEGPANVVVTDGAGHFVIANDLFTYVTDNETPFIRGDVNRDGRVSLQDAVHLLHYLYEGRNIPCRQAADVNDNGSIQLGDAVYLLDALFARGAPPAAPYPAAGVDQTPDELDCLE